MTAEIAVPVISHYAEHFEQYRMVLNRVARYDLRMFGIPTQARILDIGCGFGDDIRRLNAWGYTAVSGVESDPYCVEKRGDLDIRQGSILDTGCPNASIDAVLVDNVFHHIPAYEPAIAEITRVLRPHGLLCFIEPRNSWWRRQMDYLTFRTPLPRLLGGALRLRSVVMGEEVATGLYPQWLRSHDRFFHLLGQGFEMEWLRRNPFFFFCRAHKRTGR